MLPDANETINVTDSSDAQMEESKLLNEGGDDVPDNSIYDDPIFTDPSQRLTLLKYRNSKLPNINLNLGKKRLSILKHSAIHRIDNRAISNDQKLNDPSILAIKILTTIFENLYFIMGFFDFLRVNDSKRLTTNYYSHYKAKVNNKALEIKDAKNNTEEDKIQDKKMEDPGRDKMEHEKLVGNTKMNPATTTTKNNNIVIYSLPHSLLTPYIFSAYVIQVSQSYVTL